MPLIDEEEGMSEKRTFVLLHGGRHGGWCWIRVARLLRAAGHEVYTPTMTGLGERAHLLAPEVGLQTHIHDLVAVFEFEDITDAILVAHSAGGNVAAGAMEQIGDRVHHLVHLDSFMPLSGESAMDIVGPELAGALKATADADGEGWYLPTTDASFYGVTEPGDNAWVNSKLSAQPLKVYTDPVGETGRFWSHPGTYVVCQPSTIQPHIRERARKRSETDEHFDFQTIESAHDAMVIRPDLLTALLLKVAEGE